MSRIDEALKQAGVPRPGRHYQELPARRPQDDDSPIFRRPPRRHCADYEPAVDPRLSARSVPPAFAYERIWQPVERLVIHQDADAIAIEQYRRLAAVLHQAQADIGIKVIMVASAQPSEGKTLTAANLALTLSESVQASCAAD